MGHRQFLCLGLLFGTILTPPLVAAKHCYYYDLTHTEECVGIPMHCGKGEDCYQGRGVASSVSHINKGCVEATLCGRELSVDYMGVAYKFITLCCSGELCNASPSGVTQAEADPNIIAGSMALVLLLFWLL